MQSKSIDKDFTNKKINVKLYNIIRKYQKKSVVKSNLKKSKLHVEIKIIRLLSI